MEEFYGFSRKHGELWRSLRDGELEEDEVWAVLKEKKDNSPKFEQLNVSSVSAKRPFTSAGAADEGIRPQSAPLNIPDGSKISEEKSKKSFSSKNSSWPSYKDAEYESKIPPHEILARRFARTQISSFSVFEGVGRKLRGRDLSVVRNAVLTKTGFLE